MLRQLRQRLSMPLQGQTLALLVIVLIGIALRLYRLDAQSFWYDEGNSARIAERSLQLIVEGAAGDIHPPLYYLALHFWRAVFGDSETALRSLSAVCGVLLIVFACLAGRAALGSRTGLIAAALVALSPFAVYYSQEARMYILLALLAATSTWALLRLAQGNASGRGSRRVYVVAYTLATIAGLYSQYAYPFVMIAQGVCVLLWIAAARFPSVRNGSPSVRYAIGVYAGMNLVAIAAFLPWLPIAIRQIRAWTVTPQSYELGQAMLDAYRWLIVGKTLPLEQAGVAIGAISVLALIGFLTALRRAGSTRLAAVVLLLLALLPFGLLFVFKLYREAYLKFLLVCVTPLMILVAYGVDALSARLARWISQKHIAALSVLFAVALSLLLAVVALLPSLNNLYNNPAYARDDYRGIARLLESQARPGDAILFSAPNQWEVFTYYHRGGAPAIPLAYGPRSMDEVNQQMQPIAAQYTRLFVLYYGEHESDPDSYFERWLALHSYKAEEQWVGNIRLAAYATVAPTQTLPITATFGDSITLLSAAVDLGPARPGDILPVRLTWSANARLAPRYKVFVHVGLPNVSPVAQSDGEPGAGLHPTDTWKSGEAVDDQRAVWIKPGVPAGTYGVYVGLYDSTTGQRLPVHTVESSTSTDRLWLGDVSVSER